MKNNRILIILLLVLFTLNSYASSVEKFIFIGTITTYSNMVFSYKLDISLKDGFVKGYSITDLGGENETKCKVDGRYVYESKNLTFHELKIVSSKTSLDNTFCYIWGNTKLETRKKRTTLNGHIWGLNQKDTCAKGQINLVVQSYIINKMKKVERKIKRLHIKDSTIVETLNADHLKKELSGTMIKKNQTISYSWNSTKCIVHLWDGGIEDGDVVTLILNGDTILYKYKITNFKKTVKLNLKNGTNLIEIIANNTGSTYPNTSNLIIQGAETYKLQANLAKNEKAYLKLIVY